MNYFDICGNIVDVVKERIFPGIVKVLNGKIQEIEETPSMHYDTFIMPGFIDSHIHVESSMLVPFEFAQIASIHGTVACVSDPHEIANVLGKQGVYYMLENGRRHPLKFYFGAPSCVPATDFETSGATLTEADIRELLSNPEIKYLSEMMNFPGVIFEVPSIIEKIRIAQDYGKPVDGHAPNLTGEKAIKYINAGITTDHECFDLKEAKFKIENGMKVLIREGSAAKNFETLHSLISSYPDMVMLCSDDKHPDDLLKGHINVLVKNAISKGHHLFKVLRAASYNVIKHYNLEVGLVQEGDSADFIEVNNLTEFKVLKTYIDGLLVSELGESKIKSITIEAVNKFEAKFKQPKDFYVKALNKKIKVIEAIDGQLITNEILAKEKIENSNIVSDIENDILKISVINRYEDLPPTVGFIKNFGLKSGAIATSIAHDSHNIIVVGCSDDEIATACNIVIESKGGLAVFDGHNAFSLPLTVAGLMSLENAEVVAKKYCEIENQAKKLGCKLHYPFMTLSFMALLVIPKIKLGDKGLFDCDKFEFIDLHCS